MRIILLALGPLVLVLFACALMWLSSLPSGDRSTKDSGLIRRLVRCAAWVLLLAGILATLVVTMRFFAILACFALAVVVAMALNRYWESERHSLLWYLMVAAERGIALDAAARAFAMERHGRVAARAGNLADYLEAGMPLSLALQRSRFPLPAATLLAADMGQQTGQLGEGLRQVAGQIDAYDATLRSVLETVFYFVFLALFGFAVAAFLMIQIVPVMSKMFLEFQLEMPTATKQLVHLSEAISSPWLSLLIAVGLTGLGVLNVLHYVGLSARNLPGISRLWWRADCALVMRWLALAVRNERSLGDTLQLLAGYFPRAAVRTRIELVAGQVRRGEDWCDSLRRANLIRRADGAVLKAAERVGNLAWALEEMSDSSLRRSAYRLRACINVALPIVILAMGGGVMFIALGILLPLFHLIQGLA